MDPTVPPTTSPRRRWLRFRLRTLLLVVTVLSFPLGWVGWELGEVRKEKEAITWVEEMGGEVFYPDDVGMIIGKVEKLDERIQVNFSYTTNRSLWELTTQRWFGKRVNGVYFSSTQASNLVRLTRLKKLKWLIILNSQVSESQIQQLRQSLPNCYIYSHREAQ
jgi:hypothetical protein